MSKKLPFKVSARAARLIGRENVSNAEGAIIELVKNSYDADAKFCILYFDNKNSLHILDDGDGMNSNTIETHWMTIGTNNKETDIKTPSGRVRTGAKGIGRFALDRLGSKCHLETVPKEKADKSVGCRWDVNWQDFENEKLKTIGEVSAKLEEVPSLDLNQAVRKILWSHCPRIENTLQTILHGTAISIIELRDSWDKYSLNRLYRNLGTLIPAKEEKDFSILLISDEYPDDFGLIDAGICDDFDYKVSAKADSKQNISITITRNEQDLEKLNFDLFSREAMQRPPYDKETCSPSKPMRPFKVFA